MRCIRPLSYLNVTFHSAVTVQVAIVFIFPLEPMLVHRIENLLRSRPPVLASRSSSSGRRRKWVVRFGRLLRSSSPVVAGECSWGPNVILLIYGWSADKSVGCWRRVAEAETVMLSKRIDTKNGR